ncbi:SoxR reducing system RseC family protein [Wenzhouxiangella sp. AB-CW3]|uniref:SoxR reducing system RseC family protein n=1 Tax=Wenzhouxiangella sp. AB-CW3 TaxID=2771012 RepID=UPI00168AEAF2|nr:SoxR reducing system RseC family protein [Wenzhouxiangella sp. AB-CW3]QOC23472.1 SoxR reducing system RseC family protein [Wenzhouxiangella sp. AB-CW3]
MQEHSWQVAEVLASREGHLRLGFDRPDFCQRCRSGQGCGAGVFAALFPRRRLEIDVHGEPLATVGDWVRVGLPNRSLALAAALVYGLPLSGFVFGLLPAHFLVDSGPLRDLLALIFGLALAMAGWRLGQVLLPRQVRPVIEPLSCRPTTSRSST